MEVIQLWGLSPSSYDYIPISDGLINDSWKIEPKEEANLSEAFFLQTINHEVFHNPPVLQSNHLAIARHFESSNYPYEMPIWNIGAGGRNWEEQDGYFWRLGIFFEDTQTLHRVEHADMAWNVGKAFGIFDSKLSSLNVEHVKDTISEFHHLKRYLSLLNEQLAKAQPTRLKKAQLLLNKIDHYLYLARIPFPKNRVIHNDAKISNLLFQADEVYAIIDWDTTMAGHISWEYGDLVRTSAISVSEDHEVEDEILLRMDCLEGLTAGFKSEVADILGSSEKELLFEGLLYLIFEQAIRFLADYLAGDLYYKCSYDDHNYIRARNQFVILELLVKDQYVIKQYISRS